MQKIRILHTADMHIGSAFSGLSYDKSQLRYKEAIHTSIKIIEEARNYDLLLLAGDIFDITDIPTSVIDTFLLAVENLGEIPVFYSCGNHDYYNSPVIKYCLEHAPSNLNIFPPDKISCITLEDKNLKVYGASFSCGHYDASLFDTMDKCDDKYINILCMHSDISNGLYNYLDVTKLSDTGLHYAALGHIHSFSGIKKSGKCIYAYPGIPEGRGFDECGPKGFIAGTVSKDEYSLNFYPVSKRQYIDEKLDISDFKNEYELIDVLNELSLGINNICRFTFVGENNLSSFDGFNFIINQLSAFHITYIDKTKSSAVPSQYISHSGLKGLCAREADRLISAAKDDAEKEKYKKAFSLIIDLFEKK